MPRVAPYQTAVNPQASASAAGVTSWITRRSTQSARIRGIVIGRANSTPLGGRRAAHERTGPPFRAAPDEDEAWLTGRYSSSSLPVTANHLASDPETGRPRE